MADIDDLNYKSVTDMTKDEAIELMRQVRLSRRIPDPKKKTKSTSKRKAKAVPQVNPNQAAELLEILKGR